jgi:hypothetical protein
MTEDELRDLLAEQLEALEHGLILIKKEQFVPNALGTRGFIDLLARDARGQFVLIELKRSAASSREAIHEILKYVEGVKAHLGAHDHEIRVFIVSTEWEELLVPFSRFVSDSTIAVQGFAISVSQSTRISADQVLPVPISRGRLIAPWHELNFYSSDQEIKRGILEYEQSCTKKGISDFVLAVLDAPEGYGELAKDAFRRQMHEIANQFGEEADESHIEELAGKLDDYSSAIYFAMQILDRDKCLEIISKDKHQYAEVQECLEGMENEEALCYLHESVYACEPTPYRRGYEIGYPAKFSTLVEQAGGQSANCDVTACF